MVSQIGTLSTKTCMDTIVQYKTNPQLLTSSLSPARMIFLSMYGSIMEIDGLFLTLTSRKASTKL